MRERVYLFFLKGGGTREETLCIQRQKGGDMAGVLNSKALGGERDKGYSSHLPPPCD